MPHAFASFRPCKQRGKKVLIILFLHDHSPKLPRFFFRWLSTQLNIVLFSVRVHMRQTILTLVFILPVKLFAADEARWSFGAHVGYSPNYLVNMETKSSGTTDIFEMEYESSPEFGVTLWRMPKNNWGFMVAADVSKERKLEKLIDDGITYTPQPGQRTATFQTYFIRIGTGYRWETFYLPLGFTYGITKMTFPTSGSLDVKGGFGAFFGLGWNINDFIVIEYIGRSAVMEYTFTSATTNQTETGTGVIGSALLNLKILF